MDKRYQVFISSTYEDLIEERQVVMQALIKSHCIPSGMELFPAADETIWGLIKKVIDECDYFITIVAGRYGSEGPEGIGYTQMEYEYALSQRKPILRFLHKNPGSLPANKTELTDKGNQNLREFRKTLQENKACQFWSTPAGLGHQVAQGLTDLIQDKPGVGWRRGNLELSRDALESLRRFWGPFLKEREKEKEAFVIMSTRPGPNPWSTPRVSFNEVDAFLNCSTKYIDLGIKPKLGKSTIPKEMLKDKNIILMGSPVANDVTKNVWEKILDNPFEFITEPYNTTVMIDGKTTTREMNNYYFKYTCQGKTVEYRPKLDNSILDQNTRWLKDYGIIMRHHNIFSPGSNVMALAMGCHGVSTDAAIKLMTNSDFIEKLGSYCDTNFIALIEFDLADGNVIYNQLTPRIMETYILT